MVGTLKYILVIAIVEKKNQAVGGSGVYCSGGNLACLNRHSRFALLFS